MPAEPLSGRVNLKHPRGCVNGPLPATRLKLRALDLSLQQTMKTNVNWANFFQEKERLY